MLKNQSITTIHHLLDQYRLLIKSNRDLGTSFEHLMKAFLEIDPLYKSRFKKVSLWADWEYKWGPDCGIDIVAEDFDGEFAAIQCKFYATEYQIQKKDIDSFFNESGKIFQVDKKRTSFTQRIIVSTSDNWSEPAEKSLDGQTINVTRLHIRELEQSPIDWSKFRLENPEKLSLKEKKKLRPHQEEAIQKVVAGFKSTERGKLIMACGTGKTFTALKLAEKIAQNNGVVLFLVPSISLLSQTLREWTAESQKPFHAFAVCSDSKVGKHSEDISRHDLAIPASTDTASLIKGLEKARKDKKMTVIFSTYQSIDVVSQAQKKGLPEFDLIICDEAHRTTGVTLIDKEESHFVKVHEEKFIIGKKRIYMTATPRIFGDAVKTKADEAGAELCSMDDETLFGPEFHRLGFGKAVSENLLTDYKVLVLAIDERIIDPKFQRRFANEDQEIQLEDIAKIIGCWNGLSKRFIGEEAVVEDRNPMKRAVAFARTIKDSKQISSVFQNVAQEYIKNNPNLNNILNCELEHVDGSFNVLDRNAKLDWLKEEAPENTCRILTNARCLSEGVDVPALDAVLFLNPRDSMVDVVQSVGRIMRKAEGKKYGYVILPVGIPAGVPPDEALKDNKKYKVVWQVLQALRAHDDRFDAEVNKIELNKHRSSMIQVIGVGGGAEGEGEGKGKDGTSQLAFNMPEIEEWKDAIYAKIVLKCGSRPYWENWAADVAKIAEKHTNHIQKLLKSTGSKPKKAFESFLNGIRKNINPSISETDAIEMLSQHLITKPVFDALFEHYPFTEKNPASQSMQSILKVIESGTFKDDAIKLKSFYDSVRMRVKGINNAEARQKIIVELYDRFFKVAFPKMSDRLGIVYTPVEVVDFIINSVEAVLNGEFKESISNENVHILDPFTGTGTFIVRLLQSGIIKPEDLKRKFKGELHANEIVLLAYYIAAINIEETYHGMSGGNYVPFGGAVLADTFQSNEEEIQGSLESAIPENSVRLRKQMKSRISVIISNPPYSAGQGDANENNQNLEYPKLDKRIRDTYAIQSNAANKNSLYDSYIRALRWASDRIDDQGVIGFVTNGSFIDSNSADGLRKTFAKDFSKIYCFNLRGNARTQGEERRKEKGNVFGEGTRTPIAITIFVKSKSCHEISEIFYHEVADYLTREEKLKIVKDFGSINSISWQKIHPNPEGDWINQRNPEFDKFIALEDENNRGMFNIKTRGLETTRDAWVYNFSKNQLTSQIKDTISVFNTEVKKLKQVPHSEKSKKTFSVEDFANKDEKKISWSSSLFSQLKQERSVVFHTSRLTRSLYRPFTKTNVYFCDLMNHRVGKWMSLVPDSKHKNVAFGVTGIGSTKYFSTLISNEIPDLEFISKSQCFPLYFYEKSETADIIDIFGSSAKPDEYGYIKRDGISDFALETFQTAYSDLTISKEDLFYYIYGVLHCPTYRDRYRNDLKKMLPRIPILTNFWGFSGKGRELAEWHLNYEAVKPYELKEEIKDGAPKKLAELYKVTEMKFPKIDKVVDRSKIIYNGNVTLTGIPLETFNYIVNGKSAIEWIMERYAVSVDSNSKGEGSGIKNDPNEWSEDPLYIINLVKRVVRVSIETNRIVKELPAFETL